MARGESISEFSFSWQEELESRAGIYCSELLQNALKPWVPRASLDKFQATVLIKGRSLPDAESGTERTGLSIWWKSGRMKRYVSETALMASYSSPPNDEGLPVISICHPSNPHCFTCSNDSSIVVDLDHALKVHRFTHRVPNKNVLLAGSTSKAGKIDKYGDGDIISNNLFSEGGAGGGSDHQARRWTGVQCFYEYYKIFIETLDPRSDWFA